MGKHYVPRQHLRRFRSRQDQEMVWLYDKQTHRFAEASIAKVAQEPDFYSPDVESELAKLVERPGNIALDKLLERQELTNIERSQLSLYFMTMLTRGPRQRRKSLEHAPDVLKELISDVKHQIEEWIESGANPELALSRLEELHEVEQQFQREIPSNVIELIRTPFWSENTVECIHNMCWHILPAPPGMFFLTSDTPAHMFDQYGVGTPESEFTLTISREFALIGEHKRSITLVYENPQPRLTKEVNRRIISQSERFIFTPEKEDWIMTVAAKERPRLNRIFWQ